MAESEKQTEEGLDSMIVELKRRGFAEEVRAAAEIFNVQFAEIVRRQEEEGVPLDEGMAKTREVIAEYRAELTRLMAQKPKEKIQSQGTEVPVRTGRQEMWNSDFVSIQADLEDIGGLKGVSIDILNTRPYFRGGRTEKGTTFTMSWAPQRCLVLSISQYEKGLIDAFSAVLGYSPFCRYTSKLSGMLTYEWDSKDAEGRLAELRKDGEKGIERIRAN